MSNLTVDLPDASATADVYYTRYPGQSHHQPVYTTLRDGVLSVDWSGETGTVPADVYEGSAQRWAWTGVPTPDAVRRILPAVAGVLTGVQTDDDDIDRIIEGLQTVEADDRVVVWDAGEWLDASPLELTADTDLEALAEALRDEALAEGVHVLEGLQECLEELAD